MAHEDCEHGEWRDEAYKEFERRVREFGAQLAADGLLGERECIHGSWPHGCDGGCTFSEAKVKPAMFVEGMFIYSWVDMETGRHSAGHILSDDLPRHHVLGLLSSAEEVA